MNFHQRKRTKGMRNFGKQHHKPITTASVYVCFVISSHTTSDEWNPATTAAAEFQNYHNPLLNLFNDVLVFLLETSGGSKAYAQVAFWHWWVSGCWSALCLFLPDWSQLSFMSLSSWLGIQTTCSCRRVSRMKNSKVAVLCNCDLHNWTATMCAHSCIEYIKQAVKLVMWQKFTDPAPYCSLVCQENEWKIVQMIQWKQLSMCRSFAGRHPPASLHWHKCQFEDIQIWYIFIFQT